MEKLHEIGILLGFRINEQDLCILDELMKQSVKDIYLGDSMYFNQVHLDKITEIMGASLHPLKEVP